MSKTNQTIGENKYIPLFYNANAKLTLGDRAEIFRLFKTGEWSQRQLARKFGVSRRLIQFYADPVKLEKAKEQYAERQKTGRYYDKNKHKLYMRRHRAWKKSLERDGKLIEVKGSER